MFKQVKNEFFKRHPANFVKKETKIKFRVQKRKEHPLKDQVCRKNEVNRKSNEEVREKVKSGHINPTF